MLTTRALHIPAIVLAQPKLSLLACAILAEVLDLYQVQAQVFASDEHFAERCRCSPRKSRETIAELEAAGYLTRDVNHSRRHKRLLIPAEKWQNLPEVVAESAGSSGEICRDLWQNLPGVVAESANINTIVNTKEREEAKTAASAATFSSLSSENSGKSKPTSSKKKAAAQLEEIAALALPHPGPEFARLWAAFSTGPKQVKKPLTAHQLMLAKLGKYPEGFAIVMLEAAIQGDWSGVENGGTAEAYTKWQAEQARRPVPPFPTARPTASVADPAINHEFVAEQEAREQEELARQQAEWQAKYATPAFDPAALFGHTQPAAEGLAQARNTPEYQRYLAEEAAAQPDDDVPSAA